MSLLKKIAKSIDASVADFCDAIAARFDIDKTELLEMWTKTNGGSGLKKTKKRSAYVSFSVQIRPVVIQENPDLKFGEISKEISARWKALSAEEKAKYASVKEKAAVSPEASPKAAKKTKKASTKPKKTDASPKENLPALPDGHFSKMKIQELRDLCKEKGFKTSGNKMELIDRLVGPAEDHSDAEDKSESEESGVGTPESILSPNESETEVENSPKNVVESPENDEEVENDADDTDDDQDEDLDNMKLGELKELCKSRGLEAKGSKKDLIARLRE